MPFWLLRQGNKSRADEAEGTWKRLSGPMMRRSPLMLRLMQMSGATYNQGAGCVTYNRYAFAVSVKDSSETWRDYDALDGAMEKACN
jgi:hypothetical protein